MPFSAPFTPARRPQRGLRRFTRSFDLRPEEALREMRTALAILRRASVSLDLLLEESARSSRERVHA